MEFHCMSTAEATQGPTLTGINSRGHNGEEDRRKETKTIIYPFLDCCDCCFPLLRPIKGFNFQLRHMNYRFLHNILDDDDDDYIGRKYV